MNGRSVFFFREKVKVQLLILDKAFKWSKSTFFQSFSRNFNDLVRILNNSWNTKISTCTYARAEYKDPPTVMIIIICWFEIVCSSVEVEMLITISTVFFNITFLLQFSFDLIFAYSLSCIVVWENDEEKMVFISSLSAKLLNEDKEMVDFDDLRHTYNCLCTCSNIIIIKIVVKRVDKKSDYFLSNYEYHLKNHQ